METEALLLASELIQFLYKRGLMDSFIKDQENEGADKSETLETIKYIEQNF